MKKKIYVFDYTACTVENGELKELGVVEKLERVKDNVFRGIRQTFVIKDKKMSVLAEDAYPMLVVNVPKDDMPRELKDLRNEVKTIINPLDKSSRLSGLLYDTYFEMLSKFSQKDFEKLIKNGIVFSAHNDIKLFIKDNTGDFIEEKNITTIYFEDHPVFIYHGGLYVRDSSSALRFVRIEFTPLIISAGYLIFWGGDRKLFAMSAEDGSVKFEPLGSFVSLIKTNVNQLIKTGNAYDGFTIYHLGKKLQKVVSFEEYESCVVDEKTGKITYDYNFTMEGVDYPQTKVYTLVNGSYKLKE